MIESLKKWMLKRQFLPRKDTKQHASSKNIQNIKVLLNCKDDIDPHNIVSLLGADIFKGKTISILSYFDTKAESLIDNSYSKAQLNWYNLPSGKQIEEFTQQPCDILIVITDVLFPHFRYIINRVDAKLIVGSFVNNAPMYADILVDTGKVYSTTNSIKEVTVALKKYFLNI